MPRGFILQPTYRLESGRPVVLIHGKLEDGRSFLVRDRREAPYFFIKETDAAAARDRGARVETVTPPRHALDGGDPVARVVLDRPQDAPPLRATLSSAGVPCLEADIRFAYRYLIDRHIRSTLEIRGDGRPERGIGAVFDDPEIGPADWQPELSVLSVDIETDPTASRLLSIGLYGCGAAEVLLLTPAGMDCPGDAIACATERDLLKLFAARVRELDPDVLTGWNFVDFDLSVLQRMFTRSGVPFEIGRGPGALRIRPASAPRGTSLANVPGRVVLDGIQLLRGAFVRMESYALQAVAENILGEGKTITGSDRADSILRAWERDRPAFVEYNLKDARLVIDILDRLDLIRLTVERSRLTGMPPDRVSASIASFDFLYLSELRPLRIVAPSVDPSSSSDIVTSGGHVLEPRAGLYRNVLTFDFKSLYPSVIRTFQIDPLGRVHDDSEETDPIVAPNGAAFRRAPGVLPRLLDELVPRREAAKEAGDSVASQAIKILMNSFYGVLGTSACRFARPELANAITGFGREILLWMKARFEDQGFEVLYGDTDSLFVLSGVESAEEARQLGDQLVARGNAELAEHITSTWSVASRLELEFEKLYLRLLLPSGRHTNVGARKRYAGLVAEDGGSKVVFTGMEVVRRDWTELARQVQRELYERLFHDRPVDEYLRDVVERVRAGERDSLLIYRKALRKGLDRYTASTPPHVAAARKMSGKPGRIISYVITRDGPEPAAERRSPLDREHYVQKQVRPVAEPVLELLGLRFDRVVGDDAQLSLF